MLGCFPTSTNAATFYKCIEMRKFVVGLIIVENKNFNNKRNTFSFNLEMCLLWGYKYE